MDDFSSKLETTEISVENKYAPLVKPEIESRFTKPLKPEDVDLNFKSRAKLSDPAVIETKPEIKPTNIDALYAVPCKKGRQQKPDILQSTEKSLESDFISSTSDFGLQEHSNKRTHMSCDKKDVECKKKCFEEDKPEIASPDYYDESEYATIDDIEADSMTPMEEEHLLSTK